MKTIPFCFCNLWLAGLLLIVSCAKQESTDPSVPQSTRAKLKNAPELISARQDYSLLDVFPSYPGGDSLLLQYLKTNIHYPPLAREHQIAGKVFASFIVETDGSISNPEILRGLGYGCDDAVIAALRNMPAWTAGEIEGIPVRVKLVMPVEFHIQ